MSSPRAVLSSPLLALAVSACTTDSAELLADGIAGTDTTLVDGDALDGDLLDGDVPPSVDDASVEETAAPDGFESDVSTEPDGHAQIDVVAVDDSVLPPDDVTVAPDVAPPDTIDVTPFVLDCDAYCALMATACSGEHAQYASAAECESACGTFSLGPPGDATGNSLTCRYGRALLAEQNTADAGTLCVEAGPTGGDGCGAVCAGFCTIAQDLCVSTWVGLDCEGTCSTFPGDSTECRVAAALAGDCASTTVAPGGACEPPLPSGDQCGNALVVGVPPFTGTGDTTGATDDYHYVGGLCGGEFGGSGGKGAPDQVWQYTALQDETLRIELRAKGEFDSILYVTTGCDDVSAQCLDKKDSVGFQPAEIIEIAITAGQTLYIVVDASGPAADVGAYELKVSTL